MDVGAKIPNDKVEGTELKRELSLKLKPSAVWPIGFDETW